MIDGRVEYIDFSPAAVGEPGDWPTRIHRIPLSEEGAVIFLNGVEDPPDPNKELRKLSKAPRIVPTASKRFLRGTGRVR